MARLTFLCVLVGGLALASVNVQAQEEGGPGGRGGRGGRGGFPGGPDGPGGPGGPGGRGFMMSPLMTALDTDGDGELSAKEIEEAPAKLKTLDKDKDGKLSPEELRPTGGPGGGRGGPGMGGNSNQMVTTVMGFDKNGDGKVSKAELPERLQTMMTAADTNKDGFLDKAEVTKYAESRGFNGGNGGGRGGRGGRGGEGGPGRDN